MKNILPGPGRQEKTAPAGDASLLRRTALSTGWLARKILSEKPVKKAEEYWHNLGPGLTTGAADDDPSGIATYSQAGAKYGFSLLWLTPLTFPLMAVVQEMCARIGLVTGRGLAGNIRRHYPRWVLYLCATLVFAANTFNIGANLGAMAKAVQLLNPGASFAFLVSLFVIISLSLQIFTTYGNYAKYLKWLALVLFAYVFSAASLDLPFGEIFSGTFLPRLDFSWEQAVMICAIFGTTISPYLFFWQTSQEVEEEILAGKTTLKLRQSEVTDKEVSKLRTDVWSGMFLSNLIMFFIIITTAATLHQNGITEVRTATEAALALKPLAGNYAFLLFSVGIIGTGMLAVPVLAGSASYALSEAFGWKEGLYRKFQQARAFYGVIILAMVLGLLMNFLNLDPVKALIYSAVFNGIISPMILVLIVQMSGNKKIMGSRVNGKTTKIIGWTAAAVMAAIAIITAGGLLI